MDGFVWDWDDHRGPPLPSQGPMEKIPSALHLRVGPRCGPSARRSPVKRSEAIGRDPL
jgi:hypothetical protein